jgi:hypothetical protein
VTALLGTGAANLSPPKVCIKVLTIGPDSSSDPIPKMKKARIRGLFKSGAGDGNRTHASSLGSYAIRAVIPSETPILHLYLSSLVTIPAPVWTVTDHLGYLGLHPFHGAGGWGGFPWEDVWSS